MPNQKETARLLAKIKASQLGKDANGNLVSKRPDLGAENELLSHLGADVDSENRYTVGEGLNFKVGGLLPDKEKIAMNYDENKAKHILKAIIAKQVGSEYHQKNTWDKMVDMKEVPENSEENGSMLGNPYDPLNPINRFNPASPFFTKTINPIYKW